jgi:AraC-like DNA-binding protein
VGTTRALGAASQPLLTACVRLKKPRQRVETALILPDSMGPAQSAVIEALVIVTVDLAVRLTSQPDGSLQAEAGTPGLCPFDRASTQWHSAFAGAGTAVVPPRTDGADTQCGTMVCGHHRRVGTSAMTVTFRAADQPVTARHEYWRHVVVDALGPLDLRISGGLDERDRLVLAEAGTVRIGALQAGRPTDVDRTPRHLSSSDPDLCKVDVLMEGSGVVAQDGREARLSRGDATLVDLTRPAYWRMSPARIVAVVFPRSLLPLRPTELARLTAVRIRGDRGAGALVSSIAGQLVARVDDLGPAEATRLGTAVLDLLGVALAACLSTDSAVPADTRHRALLHRIHGFVDDRLSDPKLSPGAIAAAHHISVRYLHKLFETQGTTVAGLVRQRRLDRCRRDLLDPALADRPVSAIAARWGMPNPAHFSRLFRAAYDLSPAAYRNLAHGGARSRV